MPKIDVFFKGGSLKNRRLMTKGEGGQKSRKIDDIFYAQRGARISISKNRSALPKRDCKINT